MPCQAGWRLSDASRIRLALRVQTESAIGDFKCAAYYAHVFCTDRYHRPSGRYAPRTTHLFYVSFAREALSGRYARCISILTPEQMAANTTYSPPSNLDYSRARRRGVWRQAHDYAAALALGALAAAPTYGSPSGSANLWQP